MHECNQLFYSYQAYNGESVALLAGVELPNDQFTAVTDPYVLSLLQPQVKDEIVQVRIYMYLLVNTVIHVLHKLMVDMIIYWF